MNLPRKISRGRLRVLAVLTMARYLRYLLLCCFALSISVVARSAEAPATRKFSVPSGDASATLVQFVEQSGAQVIYVVPRVRGEITHAIRGEFTAREAIRLMLDGTALVAIEDSSGALMINRSQPQKGKIEVKADPPPGDTMRSTDGRFAPSDEGRTHDNTGAITGTVFNLATQSYLERATIRVAGTSLKTLSDKDGHFTLTGIPLGSYVVEASYTDLDSAAKSISITPSKTVVMEFGLTSGVYEMGQVVVKSTREGNAYAINQQRRAESFRTVSSIDAFGDNISGNPGEFLRNMPGIQMDFSQIEPNNIRVRGFNPEMTVVTMDGNQIASANSSIQTRSVAIDQLSLGSLEKVEVVKAPVPSMSANAIGGSVNFVTKSAFEERGRRSSLTLGLTANSQQFNFDRTPGGGQSDVPERKILPVGRFEYSNTFLEGKLGIALTSGHANTWVPADSTTHAIVYAEPLPSFPTLFTKDQPAARRGAFTISPNQQHIRRTDLSINTDYKLTENTVLFLKTWFTYYRSTNRNHSLTLTPNVVASNFSATDYTATDATASQSGNVFNKASNTWAFTPGLRYKSTDWRIDLTGGFSKATNRYSNPNDFTSVNLTLPGISLAVSTPEGTTIPTSLKQLSGPDFLNLNNYLPVAGNFVSNNVRNSQDAIFSGKLDVRRDFRTSSPFYLKAGVAYTLNERARNQPQERWAWVGPDGVAGTADDTNPAVVNMGRFAEPTPVPSGFGVVTPAYVSAKLVNDYFRANPQAFVRDLAFNYEQDMTQRRKINEAVTAAYAMASWTIGPAEILGGLRFEATKEEAFGAIAKSDIPSTSLANVMAKYSRVQTTNRYTSPPFKYLHAKYEWLPGLQSRVSYTEAIARPEFSQIFPSVTVSDATHTVTAANPGLRPNRSQNLDASLEYYTRSAGQWTFAWFQRDVKNYLGSTSSLITQPDAALGIGPDLVGYSLTTTQNLGHALWQGYEVDVRQQLRDFAEIPRWMHGLEFFANFTRIERMSGNFGVAGASITRLAGVSPRLYNAGLSYRTPRGNFYVQVTTNFQAAILAANYPTAAGQNLQQTDPYQLFSLEARYRVSPRVMFTVTGRNLGAEVRTLSQLGRTINEQNDSGTFWLFSTKIEL